VINSTCGTTSPLSACAENSPVIDIDSETQHEQKQFINALDRNNCKPQDLSVLTQDEWLNLNISHFVTRNLQFFIKSFVLKITSNCDVDASTAQEISDSAPGFVYITVVDPIEKFHKKNLNLKGEGRNSLLFGIGVKAIEYKSMSFFHDQGRMFGTIDISVFDRHFCNSDSSTFPDEDYSNSSAGLEAIYKSIGLSEACLVDDRSTNSFDQRVADNPLNTVLSLIAKDQTPVSEDVYLLSDDTPTSDIYERIQHAMIESVSSLLSKTELALLRCIVTESETTLRNRVNYSEMIHKDDRGETSYYPVLFLRRKLQGIIDDPDKLKAVRELFSKGFSL
jgi:hypothetical protein